MTLPEFHFSVVCKYLNPKDIFHLSQTCKLYENLYQPLKFEITEKGTYISDEQSNTALLPYAGLTKNTKLILSDVPHVLYSIDYTIKEMIDSIVVGYYDEYDIYILSKFYHLSLEEIENKLPGVVKSKFVKRVDIIKINKRCEFPNAIEIYVHDDVKALPRSAFRYYNHLEYIDISNVTKLNIHLFEQCEKLKEVKLNKMTTHIPDSCFKGCQHLEKINLDNIVSIDDCAFVACCRLKEVKLNKMITRISAYCFRNCQQLKKINLDNIVSIDNCAFENCYNLEDVGSLSNVKKMGSNAFNYCKSLKCVEVRCEEIPECCFYNTGIRYVDLSSVKILGWRCFGSCSVERVTLGKELKVIPDCCFIDSRLEEIDLSNVEKIGTNAFSDCLYLKTVNLGEKIKYIPKRCFDRCISLTSINLEDDVEVHILAFCGCKNLKRY